MQCPNCHFENMPGSRTCGRCRAQLSIGQIDVNPPRASRRQKVLPARTQRSFNRFRKTIVDGLSNAFFPRQTSVHFDGKPSEWVSMLVCGLLQWRRGEVGGWVWCVSWLILLGCALLFAGTSFGVYAIGALFAVHVASIINLFFRQFEELSTRIRFTLLTATVLGFVYYGSIRTMTHFAVPITINAETEYFSEGSVLWYVPNAKCQLGDLVIYDIPSRDLAGRRGNQAAVFRVAGSRVNRIVAENGQKVVWRNQQLFVDDQLAPWQPGRTMQIFRPFDIVVPQNCVFLSPENLIEEGQNLVTTNSGDIGIVPTSSIMGRIRFRSYPTFLMRFY